MHSTIPQSASRYALAIDTAAIEREQLAALSSAAAEATNQWAAWLSGAVASKVHRQLSALLIEVACVKLPQDLAADVRARMHLACKSRLDIAVPPVSFEAKRAESGEVTLAGCCLVDAITIEYSSEAGYGAKERKPSVRQLMQSETTGVRMPSPQVLIEPPQVTINNGAPAPTRQHIARDERGEISSIDTVPI